jgi:hypothetical protein
MLMLEEFRKAIWRRSTHKSARGEQMARDDELARS